MTSTLLQMPDPSPTMVYDAIYVSLAKVHETILMTADKKLMKIMRKTVFKKHVAWLGDNIG